MFSHGTKSRSFALFDIGDTSIAAGLAVSTPEGVRLLWHVRREYGFQSSIEYERYERTMYATLLEVGMQLTSEGARIASTNGVFSPRGLTVLCIFAPPWFLGSVRTVLRKKEKPFEVTHSVADEVRSELFSTFLSEPETVSWCGVMGNPEPFEECFTKVCLNGYPVFEVQGCMTNELSLTGYIAIVSESIVHKVRDILRRVLPNHDQRMTTSTRLLTGVDARIRAEQGRKVLVELGGQVTGVSFVENGALRGTTTFPHGTHRLLRACVTEANSFEEAYSACGIADKQFGATGAYGGSHHSINEVLEEWHNGLIESVDEVTDGITPPRYAELVADERLRNFYTRTLRLEWKQHGVRRMRSMEGLPFSPQENIPPSVAADHDFRFDLFLRSVDDFIMNTSRYGI